MHSWLWTSWYQCYIVKAHALAVKERFHRHLRRQFPLDSEDFNDEALATGNQCADKAWQDNCVQLKGRAEEEKWWWKRGKFEISLHSQPSCLARGIDDTECLQKFVEINVPVFVYINAARHVFHSLFGQRSIRVLWKEGASFFEFCQGDLTCKERKHLFPKPSFRYSKVGGAIDQKWSEKFWSKPSGNSKAESFTSDANLETKHWF